MATTFSGYAFLWDWAWGGRTQGDVDEQDPLINEAGKELSGRGCG